MNDSSRRAVTSEQYINFDDTPEERALNFPPTEIDRLPTDDYIPCDLAAMDTFTYPSNVSHREYQYNVSQICFRYNTLVCLPTGAGKTFIAAVVMMNFYRWYPQGKIIFMAPTRTLVNQQVEACANFTNIKKDRFIIMTGNNTPGAARKEIWKQKSVFFCTPQIVQNDIAKKRLDPSKIILLIVDEAHHARNNYAYSVVVRQIAARSSQFRVIGLSATPGSDLIGVQSVIYNLMISKIFYLDESDPDIAQYQHETNIEFVPVKLGTDESVLEDALGQIIQNLAQQLQVRGHLKTSNPKTLTRGTVYFQMNSFQKSQMIKNTEFFRILDQFSVLLSLTSMMEKLAKYGTGMLNQALKDFQNKKQSVARVKVEESPQFQSLLKLAERSKNVSHPKLARLGVIIEDFINQNPQSRIIVFTQFRASAVSIEEHLKKIPIVKCSIFVGHNDTRHNEGLDESTQIAIIDLFRKGSINCIIATSVGEEGLDIGEVDLIVCFDTTASPLKTVQRMGRTGRKRKGKVIFLMTEGIEEKNIAKAQNTRNYMKTQLNNAANKFTLYEPSTPNLPLPDILSPLIVPCAQLGSKIKKPKDSLTSSETNDDDDTIQGLQTRKTESHSPFLNNKQNFALGRCFGMKLKYLPIRNYNWHTLKDSVYASAESQILSKLFSKEDELERIINSYNGDNSDTDFSSSSDDDDVQKALKKSSLSIKKSQETTEIKKKTFFDSSDEGENEVNQVKIDKSDIFKIDDDDDLSAPCIPLSAFLNNDNDDEEEEKQEKPTKSTTNPQFLADDDISDIEYFDKLALKNQNTKIEQKPQQPHFLSSDSDDIVPNFQEIKQNIGQKTQVHFLDDSDIDIDI